MIKKLQIRRADGRGLFRAFQVRAFQVRAFQGARRKYTIPTLLGLLITTFFALLCLSRTPMVEHLGDLLFDSYQRASPRDYNPEVPVRIIDIDDESLARIGQWPWPRTTIAKMHDRLAQAEAALVAYDIVFSEADRTSPENIMSVLRDNPSANASISGLKELQSHDSILSQSFAKTPTVGAFFMVPEVSETLPVQRNFAFVGRPPNTFVKNYGGAIQSLPVLQEGFAGQGSVSIEPGVDGIVRTAPLLARIGESYFPSLSLEVLRTIFDTAIKVKTSDSGDLANVDIDNISVSSIQVANFDVPTTADGGMRVYYTAPHPERYIPAWKILSDEVPMSEWANDIAYHLVFIGTGALGLKDIKATPIRGAEPGVLIHAQVVEQILDETYLRRPFWAGIAETFALIFAGLLLAISLPRLTAARSVILTLSIALIITLGSGLAFRDHLMLLNPIYALMTILTVYVVTTLVAFYLTETERSRIRNAFSMYLSPTMVKKVSDDPSLLKLGGEEREMTLLFLDIRSFSKISEGMSPQDITTFLNIFLTPMTNIIQDNKGTIDKYIGDAIVAFWNAPLDDNAHEANAARAVIDMHTALTELNAKYIDDDEIDWPGEVTIGIGLNTGLCCVGNLGSDQRFSYSMIGDAVNVAARIEGLTKQYGVGTLIGEATAKAVPGFAMLEADLIRVVGRQTPERIHILLGDEKLSGDADFQHLATKHAEFLTAYRAQDWGMAKILCDSLGRLAAGMGGGKYYAIMRERVQAYEDAPPPKDWDGVYKATRK